MGSEFDELLARINRRGRFRKAHFYSMPFESLIELSLSTTDEGDYWDMVVTAVDRDPATALDRGLGLCESEEPISRTLGYGLIGEVCVSGRIGESRVPERLLEACATESDEGALPSLLIALSKACPKSKVGMDFAIDCKSYPSPIVRDAVANFFLSYGGNQAIKELKSMLADSDDFVRDWVSFCLSEIMRTEA